MGAVIICKAFERAIKINISVKIYIELYLCTIKCSLMLNIGLDNLHYDISRLFCYIFFFMNIP